MAVFALFVVAASMLTSFVAAVPLNAPRALRTYTHYKTAWVTVEETATVWVNQADPTLAANIPADTPTDTPNEVPAQPTDSQVAAEAAAPSVYSEPPPPPVPSASSDAVVVPAVVPSTFTTTTAPAATETPPAGINVQPKSAASPAGSCEGNGDMCVGDVTHWDGGLGACGWTVDTNAENVIALPFAFMGTQSNGNPYCGRAVTLVNPTTGTTVQATVGDKCMGCVDRAIDCTNILFEAITDGQGDGRFGGIEWYFTT